MSRWWRAHASALDDPKVQRLPGETFKAWFNVLCIACIHEGTLPPLADIAFALRKSEDATAKMLDALQAVGLLDVTENGLAPHNWNGRQYKSDVSTARVKEFRERRRNVSVTPSESETDTDTETEGAKAPSARARRPAKEPTDERIKLPKDFAPTVDDRNHVLDAGGDPDTSTLSFCDFFWEGRGRNEKRTLAGWVMRWKSWCATDAARRSGPRGNPGFRAAHGDGGDAGAFARAAAILGGGKLV